MADSLAPAMDTAIGALRKRFSLKLSLSSIPVLAWLVLIVLLPNLLLIGTSF